MNPLPPPEPAGLLRVLTRIETIKAHFRPARALARHPGGLSSPSPASFSQALAQAGQPSPATIRQAIASAAARHGIQPALLLALAEAESDLRPDAVSPDGALGIMQLMPATARRLGVADPFDIPANVDAGARYLREQLDRFGGDPALAIAAYNAGPEAVLQHGGIPPYAETRALVHSVLARASRPPLPAPPSLPPR